MMGLNYQFITATILLLTIAQRRGITTKPNSDHLWPSLCPNDTQSESSNGDSSNSILLLCCNFTNATVSQDCQFCFSEPNSTQIENSTADAGNQTRCVVTYSECDGSTEQCLRDGLEAAHCCMHMNLSTNGDQESETELLRPTLRPVSKYLIDVLLLAQLPDAVDNQGGTIIPAVLLAAEQINKRDDILSSYQINVQVRDSGCDKVPKTAIEIVTILRNLSLSYRTSVTGIIGPACSEESVFVNTFFNRHFFDEPIPVFYSGTSPYLSEKANKMKNAFGMISSATVLVDTLIGIANKEEWNWENIAVFYDGSRRFFQDIYITFIQRFNNSQQFGYTSLISDSWIPLKQIIDTNIRIVVVFSGKKPARQVVCIAGQSDKLVFPIRQFIFLERTLENFLGDEPSFFEHSERKRYHCEQNTVMRGLNGSVLLNQALDSVNPDVVTVSNYTVGQVKEQYKERLSQYSKDLNTTLLESIYAYPYYDAMWAYAYGWEISLTSFNNTFVATNYAIRNNVSFQGVSSWIDFKNKEQQVSNPVRISQINGSNVTTIGPYNNLTYPPNMFISDKFIVINVLLHPSLISVGFTSSFFLLLFIANVHILNVIHRNHPSIKASSQRLNHFIFVGCYLFVMAITSYTVQGIAPDTVGLVLCNMNPFCIVLGYCLIILTVLVKSWRTYRIFNHPFKRTQFLGDFSLALFIMGCALASTLSFIPFFIQDPFQKRVSSVFDTSQWPPVRKETTVCYVSERGFLYISIPLTFQLFLTAATIFLATMNKSIKYSDFRNTKQIFVFVYLLAVTWAVGGSLLVTFYLHFQDSRSIVYPVYIALLVVTVILSVSLLQLSAYVQVFNSRTSSQTVNNAIPLLRTKQIKYKV